MIVAIGLLMISLCVYAADDATFAVVSANDFRSMIHDRGGLRAAFAWFLCTGTTHADYDVHFVVDKNKANYKSWLYLSRRQMAQGLKNPSALRLVSETLLADLPSDPEYDDTKKVWIVKVTPEAYNAFYKMN